MLELLNLNILYSILLYAFLGVLGSFAKEVFTYSKRRKVLNWNKLDKKSVILGGLLTAITMPTLEIYLLEKVHVQLLLLISFVMGVLSMELFNSISTLSNLKKAYKEVKDMRDVMIKLKVDQKFDNESVKKEVNNNV